MQSNLMVQGWTKHDLTEEGDPYPIVLFLQDPEKVLRRLLSCAKNAPDFAFSPQTIRDALTGERRVSSPPTAIWWERAQEHINKSCLGAIIAALILYSDQTTLSNDRRTSGWPLVLTLANIAMELRGQPEGHALLAVFPILRAVPGHPGFEPNSEAFRHKIRVILHRCLQLSLAILKELSFSGLVAAGPDGAVQTFYPLLFSYVCDHPEGCKVTCTKDSNQTQCPCSVCLVPADKLNDVGTKHAYRTQALMEAEVDKILAAGTDQERERISRQYSVHPIKSSLFGFNGGDTDWGDAHKTVQVDMLHQSDIGVFPMAIDALILAAAGSSNTRLARAIDANLMTIRDTCRFADLRIPGSDKGGYCSSKKRSKFAAFEHRGVMQVIIYALVGLVESKFIVALGGFIDWYMAACRPDSFTKRELDDLNKQALKMVDRLVRVLGGSQTSEFGTVKVHSVSHYPDCIWRSGTPNHYSANLYESLHIELLKRGYRMSNHRDAIQFVIFHHRRLCSLRALAGLDAIDKMVEESPPLPCRESALIKALRSCKNELSAVTLTLRGAWLESISLPDPPPFGAVSKDALDLLGRQNELRLLYPELKAFLGPDFARVKGMHFNVHANLGVPPGPTPRHAKRAMYARASSNFHRKPWFSNVVIKAEADGQPPVDWYAQVRLFLSCTISRPAGVQDEVRELALVRYYNLLQAPDVVTKSRRLVWERPNMQYRIVSVHNILRLAHILPNFSKPDEFFINRTLFEHHNRSRA